MRFWTRWNSNWNSVQNKIASTKMDALNLLQQLVGFQKEMLIISKIEAIGG